MNIITDLRQHHVKFDGSVAKAMPFEIDRGLEAFYDMFGPETMIDKAPDLPDNDLSRIVMSNMTVRMKERANISPAYYPKSDLIRLVPKSEYLANPDTNYLHSVMHELGHATGHHTRLNRGLGLVSSISDYSFEELVAEQTAALMLDKYGLYEETRDQMAYYVARFIYYGKFVNPMETLEKAAQEAEKAVEFMTRRNSDV